jgi:hypothetical protein
MKYAFWLPGTLGLLIGCGSDGGGSDCQAGTIFCPCLNGQCQVGLVCSNNFCLSPDGGTSGDGDPGDGDPGDGDPGDGDPGDGDPGDGDGDPGDGDPGDGDGDPDPNDADSDGITNALDNCPADANPNQLDFDTNGLGNVCDPLVFTDVSGTLTTSLEIDGGFVGDCVIPAQWYVSGGTVQVQLNDDASVANFEISDLVLGQVFDSCELAFPFYIVFLEILGSYTGNPFPVDVPHSIPQHNVGMIEASSNAPHPMQLTSDVGSEDDMGNLAMVGTMDLAGSFPQFDVTVSGGGSAGTITWSSMDFVVTPPDMIMIEHPVPFLMTYQWVGVEGELDLSP